MDIREVEEELEKVEHERARGVDGGGWEARGVDGRAKRVDRGGGRDMHKIYRPPTPQYFKYFGRVMRYNACH